ncbi:ferrous iron transport protein B, partial [bacterium]|nr:ferrous iron transport protein B [bacterium]
MHNKPRPYRIALIGQPNSGKSTIFNNLAGFKTLTGNFPGTTVSYTKSSTRFMGKEIEIIDLPGIYSLSYSDIAEKVARDFILKEEIDAIINVADASVLSRSLELTLQLLELGKPLVLCLNMMDEARKKGLEIDIDKLSQLLGIPVIPTTAVRGIGIVELMRSSVGSNLPKPSGLKFRKDVEEAIEELDRIIPQNIIEQFGIPRRFFVIRLLEGETELIDQLRKAQQGETILKKLEEVSKRLEESHGVPANLVLSSERHALSLDIFEQVAKIIHPPKRTIDDIIDIYAMHPVVGYLLLGAVLGIVFLLVFKLGNFIGNIVLSPFDKLDELLSSIAKKSIIFAIFQGIVQGIAGGIGIVLPYLIPLLLFISFLEDAGYLPRAAFLLDGLFHRIGLHGKSVIPFILGYGCNVPALIVTRILDSPLDRLITGLLVSFIPCSARSIVILALVGAYLGPFAALALYFLNLIVIGILGRILRGLFPGSLEPFLMDIPTYKFPPFRHLWKKTYFRMYEFLVFAWPLIILASVLMSLLSFYKIDNIINSLLS